MCSVNRKIIPELSSLRDELELLISSSYKRVAVWAEMRDVVELVDATGNAGQRPAGAERKVAEV